MFLNDPLGILNMSLILFNLINIGLCFTQVKKFLFSKINFIMYLFYFIMASIILSVNKTNWILPVILLAMAGLIPFYYIKNKKKINFSQYYWYSFGVVYGLYSLLYGYYCFQFDFSSLGF